MKVTTEMLLQAAEILDPFLYSVWSDKFTSVPRFSYT